MREWLIHTIGIELPGDLDSEELVRANTYAFLKVTKFLSSSETFPNRSVNNLVQYQADLVRHARIPIVIQTIPDEENDKLLSVLIETEPGRIEKPSLIIDSRFLNALQEDPVEQITVTVALASLLRDYWCHRIQTDHQDNIASRSGAYAAETLLTLKWVFSSFGESLTFSPEQQKLVKDFPTGINTLFPGVNYNAKFKPIGQG